MRDLVVANRILANRGRGRRLWPCQRAPSRQSEALLPVALARAGTGRPRTTSSSSTIEGEPVQRQAPALSRALHPCGDLRGAARRDGGGACACRGHAAVRHRPRHAAASRSSIPAASSAARCRSGISPTNSATPILLVTNMAQGRDLAKCIGKGNVALMRGHGFASAARRSSRWCGCRFSSRATRASSSTRCGWRRLTSLCRRARSRGAGRYKPKAPETWRAWEYWARRAGVADLLGDGPS